MHSFKGKVVYKQINRKNYDVQYLNYLLLFKMNDLRSPRYLPESWAGFAWGVRSRWCSVSPRPPHRQHIVLNQSWWWWWSCAGRVLVGQEAQQVKTWSWTCVLIFVDCCFRCFYSLALAPFLTIQMIRSSCQWKLHGNIVTKWACDILNNFIICEILHPDNPNKGMFRWTNSAMMDDVCWRTEESKFITTHIMPPEIWV